MHRTVVDGMDPMVSVAIGDALMELSNYIQLRNKSIGIYPSLSLSTIATTSSQRPSINAITSYLLTVHTHPHRELAFIFLLHTTILDSLPLQGRAQQDYFRKLSPTLNYIVHRNFLSPDLLPVKSGRIPQ
jgi:hypothetical protein